MSKNQRIKTIIEQLCVNPKENIFLSESELTEF